MTAHSVRYVGPSDIHDARVVALEHYGDTARVTLASYEGRRFTIEFSGVNVVDAYRPIDMVLYALSEVDAAGPGRRRFDFTAADEDSVARLAVEATGFTVVGDGMPPAPGA